MEPVLGILEVARAIKELLTVFSELAKLEEELKGFNIHKTLANITKLLEASTTTTS